MWVAPSQRCQLEPVAVDVGDHDVAGTDVAHDRGRHRTDRPGAGDQHVLTDHVEPQCRVGGVTERIEHGGDVVVDVIGYDEHVLSRDHDELGECPRPGDTDTDVVVAELASAALAVAAVTTRDVALTRHPLPDLEPGHVAAELGDLAHELVSDHHRHRDRRLRPGVPAMDVQIGAADRCLVDLDQDLVGGGGRLGDVVQPEPGCRLCLHQCLHHTTPICSPIRVKASIASVMSSSEWAADIWVRIRACTGRHHGEREGGDVDPFGQQQLGHLTGDPGVTQHDRDDRVPGARQRETGGLHAGTEALRVAFELPLEIVGRLQQFEHPQGGGGDHRCQRVAEQVGPRPLPQPLDDLTAPAGVAARSAAHRLAERAGDDVDPIDHSAVLGCASPTRPDKTDGVRVVDHHQCVVAVGEVADRRPGRRSRRPSRTRRRWRSGGSERQRPPAIAAPARPCRCCRIAAGAPC